MSGYREQLKVLLVHTRFDIIGGAEIVALRFLEFLASRKDVEVTLCTLVAPEWKFVKQQTGISLSEGACRIQQVACPEFFLRRLRHYEHIRVAFLQRAARKLAKGFDVCVSTCNEMDFGKKGIQYIHFPLFASRKLRVRYGMTGAPSVISSIRLPDEFYQHLLLKLSGNTIEGFRRNVTLVNSRFIGSLVEKTYDVQSTVVYPAVDWRSRTGLRVIPWEKKKARFISVGRIMFDKNHLYLLEIFASLLREFPEATFAIVGHVADRGYLGAIELKGAKIGLPLTIHSGCDREQLLSLLNDSKYYIHARHFEHFGIAVLEAIRMGCIPFVHDSGGQKEVVRPDILRYERAADMVGNVIQLTRDPKLRRKVLGQLQRSVRMFDPKSIPKALERALRLFRDSPR